ncbi:D-mannonate oxidoreductase [Citrobacter werkmanii]|uniref:D-mannonate oxidoreductase n=1 Tax=Citrobacter werkmanii TaxID=67827 RepID=A0ABM8N5D8_9ENTR|nr:D-mannonate oxidoreductase [Citrobacter werkmanii]CAC9253177.1 D-mannonate oxidoreductase [Citrobacter werkmanii]CAC9318882.1 D-mannonate oxidoreductase [Citrobacter werkmanii]
MEQNIVSGSLSATRPQWDGSRLVSRIVHRDAGRFTVHIRRCLLTICWSVATATGDL